MSAGLHAWLWQRAVWILALPLHVYRKALSPLLPRRCRYEPTCSAYAIAALRQYGPLRGLVLAAWRVVRCNPLSDGGLDPVEAQTVFGSSRRDTRGTATIAGARGEGRSREGGR